MIEKTYSRANDVGLQAAAAWLRRWDGLMKATAHEVAIRERA